MTPGVDLDTGEAQLWQQAGRLADSVQDAVKPMLVARAERIGREEGAQAATDGTPINRPLLAFGDVAQARVAAANRAYVAGRSNDFDAAEAAIRLETSHDVEAYRARMGQLRSEFIQQADPDFAVDIEQYANRQIEAGVSSIAGNVAQVALREQAVELSVRQANLSRKIADALDRDGTAATVDYELLRDEWEQLREARLNNPAIPYSQAEAERDELELRLMSKAAVYTSHIRRTLQTEGAAAALEGVGDVLRDPDLQGSERDVVFQRVRETINREVDLVTDQVNMARSSEERARREMERRVEDYASAIEVGLPDTGLTESEVLAVMGPSGVAEFHRKSAEAAERRRLTGSLIGLPPEEARARARAALPSSTAGVTTIEDLAKPLNTPTDFDALASAIRMVETRGNPRQISRDPDGAGPAGGGAVGAMQLLPETARDMARLEGVPYDERRLLIDPDYNERLGKRYLKTLLDRYDGNPLLASMAYHAGPGYVDGWIQPVGTTTRVQGPNGRMVTVRGRGDPRTGEVGIGEFLASVARGNPRSAAYPRAVAEALAGGQADAEWRETQAQAIVTNATEGFASDPVSFAFRHQLSGAIPLDVDSVFIGGDAGAQWSEALRARGALGGNLADQHGVPLRYFTNGEVAAYRDRFNRDPASAVEFARRARAALGARGARDALAEVGQGDEASAAIHLSDLAVSGDASFVDQATRGLSLAASGQTLEKEARDEIAESLAQYRTQFRNAPSLMAAITNSARAAALADQADGQAQRRTAEEYVQAAMGRTQFQGRNYGGVTRVNGSTVLLPRWLATEQADDALRVMAANWAERGRGPVYSNGQPMPAREISRMTMVVMQNGLYSLVDGRGRVAYARNGQPFQVNLDAGRDFIRARLGAGAVRPD